jgi:C-terminal peptidase prc
VVADAARHLGQAALGAAAAAVLLVAPLPAAAAAVLLVAPLPAAAAARTVTFPVAERPELFAVQKTLVEAWTIISQSFVDPTFNHQDWPAQLQGELAAVAAADSPAAASAHVATMIKSLGDPYTRWVPRSEYMDFRVSSDGELKGGVGLLIASDPSSGRLVVLAPIKGSPADRAGIRPGDEVLAVDGASMAGRDGEAAARFLRGQQGSSVTVKVARRRGGADQVPGVAAGLLPRAPTVLPVEYKHFRLRREKVELSPVFATTLTRDDHAFGYVRLTQFGQHAAADMRAAIAQLTRDGAESFILDLRNNPGGLVRASLEVAALWMDGEARPTVFSVQDRQDAEEEAALVDGDLPPGAAATRGGSAAQRVVLRGGHAATVAPLVVLVNKQSASASEILAGALHDNGRAEVIGGAGAERSLRLSRP